MEKRENRGSVHLKRLLSYSKLTVMRNLTIVVVQEGRMLGRSDSERTCPLIGCGEAKKWESQKLVQSVR